MQLVSPQVEWEEHCSLTHDTGLHVRIKRVPYEKGTILEGAICLKHLKHVPKSPKGTWTMLNHFLNRLNACASFHWGYDRLTGHCMPTLLAGLELGVLALLIFGDPVPVTFFASLCQCISDLLCASGLCLWLCRSMNIYPYICIWGCCMLHSFCHGLTVSQNLPIALPTSPHWWDGPQAWAWLSCLGCRA